MSKKIEYSADYEKLRDDLNFKMNTIRHSSYHNIPDYLFALQMKVSHTKLNDFLIYPDKRSLRLETLFKFCNWLGNHPSRYIKTNGK